MILCFRSLMGSTGSSQFTLWFNCFIHILLFVWITCANISVNRCWCCNYPVDHCPRNFPIWCGAGTSMISYGLMMYSIGVYLCIHPVEIHHRKLLIDMFITTFILRTCFYYLSDKEILLPRISQILDSQLESVQSITFCYRLFWSKQLWYIFPSVCLTGFLTNVFWINIRLNISLICSTDNSYEMHCNDKKSCVWDHMVVYGIKFGISFYCQYI